MLSFQKPEKRWSICNPPAARDSFLAAERNGALAMPPRPAAMFNVNEKDRAWVDAQNCWHASLFWFTDFGRLGLAGLASRVPVEQESGGPGIASQRVLAKPQQNCFQNSDFAGSSALVDFDPAIEKVAQDRNFVL